MSGEYSAQAYLRRRSTPELLAFLRDYATGQLPEPYDDEVVQLVRDEVTRRAENFDDEPCPE
jgi:hypothetical protein